MVDISVGEVSGFIAAGVFVLQVFFPLALPAILIAFVSDTHTLVTWSVLGRFLQSTPWPTLLNTDTVATTGVKRRVNVVSWFLTAAVALVAIASIVTPLGLYESIEPEDSQEITPFKYIKDTSAFGYGTPPRPDAYFARYCGTSHVCPGSTSEKKCEKVGLLERCTADVNITLPENFIAPFRDGATKFSSSVSSIFDMQWRTYVNDAIDPSKGVFLRPVYRQLAPLLLEDKIMPVEGLVVDVKTGGIGFRSHTVPERHFEYGSKWNEDILFIEPETKCVNLNFTLDFKIPRDIVTSDEYVEELRIVDHGGFSGLRKNPAPSLKRILSNGQVGINLRDRAASAAWFNNFLTMVFYNATNPDMDNIKRLDVSEGDSFPLPSFSHNTSFRVGYEIIRSNMEFGEYLNLTGKSGENGTKWSENPFDISMRNFSFITNLCAGSTFSSPANINTTLVGCSLLYGAAARTDKGGSSLTADPGSNWSLPVYSCASAVKALVKEVTFQYNGTNFEALKINATKPKAYPDATSKPLWAVEDLKEIPISDGKPLWGILGPSDSANNENAAIKYPSNISTTTHEHLYLPGYMDDFTMLLEGSRGVSNDRHNLPGTEFYTQAMLAAVTISRPGSGGYRGYVDYSGQTSLALFAKWQELSKTAEGAARIMDLVWTDSAANAVLGTKGWGLTSFSARAQPREQGKREDNRRNRKRAADKEGPAKPLVPVTVFKKHIRYKVPFAVPAFLVLAITVVILVPLIVLCVMGRTGPKKMRTFLEASSTGRNVGTFLASKGDEAGGKKTKEWVKSVGMKVVKISKGDIKAEGEEGTGDAEGGNGSQSEEEKVDGMVDEEEVRGEEEADEQTEMMTRSSAA
ncbi:hypothetical protein AJ79_05192 [Helicocarpus griseus UAMH5409]|uniref:Uncharacterized protein n=1 Tax=Helicocarpus griseus UAMH5409 TaxID=1447875 RepID=A0A2B7XP56_9EURO|nr:hypothetical protein AJ79_05192 [Helicocarpus griseus UAMH5409]